jgi:hypothetical protein
VAMNSITKEKEIKRDIFAVGESSPSFGKRRSRIIFAMSELKVFVIDINSFALGNTNRS